MSKIFRLTIGGTYQGVNWNNVFHWFTASDDGGQALLLLTEFDTQWTNALLGIMNNQVNILNYSAVAVPDDGDYSTLLINENGTFGSNGTKLPPAYTYAFTLNTQNSPIRHGFKRFVGVDEDAITAGVPNATFITAYTTLVAKFEDNLNISGYTFVHIIPRYSDITGEITLFTAVTGGQFTRLGYQRTRES